MPATLIQNDLDGMDLAVKVGDQIVERLCEMGYQCDIDLDDGIKLGPRTIRYNLILAPGSRVKEIVKYKDDLQYDLGVQSVRVLAPVPGKRNIGIEIPRADPQFVALSDFTANSDAPLTFPLGITPEGEEIYFNLPEMGPHALVAGTSGAGKSSMLHAMICSLISRFTPDELTIVGIDTKCVELTQYENIPHLAAPIITDAYETPMIFEGIIDCMNERYNLLQEYGVKDLTELNGKLVDKLPYCLVVVDELADLIMVAKHQIEESVVRIAQKARAVGIHLVLATQSPRREIVSGILKANLASRIAFATGSELDSRIILDEGGSAQLLGSGDGLFSLQGKPAIRLQTPYVTPEEIAMVINNLSDTDN